MESARDDDLLLGLGQRLEAHRLRRGWTQAQLAGEAGVSKSTVERLEAGSGGQTRSLIALLRALGLHGDFSQLAPSPQASPMEQLGGKSSVRRRAPRRPASPDPSEWVWGDER